MHHERTKYVEVDWYFIKEKIREGIVCISYIPTKKQLANIFTNEPQIFSYVDLTNNLRMINIFELAWGGIYKIP